MRSIFKRAFLAESVRMVLTSTWILGILILALAPVGLAATLPELPRAYLDTTYDPPTGGQVITVNAGGDLQAAIDSASPGDIIDLEAGATFNGSFFLPNKGTDERWIYIRSSAHGSLPAPGNRVSPFHGNLMPKMVVRAGQGGAIQTEAGAHHYRFVGIEFKPVSNQFVYNLVDIGAGSGPSLSSLPHDFTFDRCYFHGDPNQGTRRGMAMNGKSVAVIDSHFAAFAEIGADSQAIAGWTGSGPFKIVNNYLEGAGENVMFGGGDPSITNLVPSDIEIRGNYFFKPLSWYVNDPGYAGTHWSVKNLFELKNAQRVLIEGNIFENCWADAQNGFAILFTVRNQDGTAPWSTVQDITFQKNILRHIGSGINLLGTDDLNPSQRTKRILIKDNLLEDINGTRMNADGRIFQFVTPDRANAAILDLTVDHNTALHNGTGQSFVMAGDTVPVAENFVFQNIMVTRGSYGFAGSGTGEGTATLNHYYVNHTFEKNVIIGDGSIAPGYPANNYFPDSMEEVGFVNFSGGNYRLSDSSPYRNSGTDGKDIGTDIEALELAIACVIAGTCESPPPPDTEPPTAPKGLTATVISSTQINLSWFASTDNRGVTGYRIYRNGKEIGTTAGTSYQSTALKASTSYTYRVKAYDEAGNKSAKSAAVTRTTQPVPSTKFMVGDRVRTIEKANVRSAPSNSGTVSGTQSKAAQGGVVGGPWYWNQRWWWEIDFDNGMDGWVAQGKLKKVVP